MVVGDVGDGASDWGGGELGCGEGQVDDWGFGCGVAVVLETEEASESFLLA